MKTSNYSQSFLRKHPSSVSQTFRDYDLITLNLPAPRQRLCPCCGSTNCVIKDSGVWQTVRHLPSHHRGTAVAFHKRRLFCKECHTSFYENPYWIHPSLHMTQALYDSIFWISQNLFPSLKLPDITVLRRASSSPFLKPFASAFRKNFRNHLYR